MKQTIVVGIDLHGNVMQGAGWGVCGCLFKLQISHVMIQVPPHHLVAAPSSDDLMQCMLLVKHVPYSLVP
jgi:hypothetical protein